jgi:hypothetical protein
MAMKVFEQKPLPVSLHRAMNPTWTELRSSPGLRNNRPATNTLNIGTVTPQYENVKYVCRIVFRQAIRTKIYTYPTNGPEVTRGRQHDSIGITFFEKEMQEKLPVEF